MIPLSDPLITLFEHLHRHNIRAILVGGFIRDTFTRHPTHDLDVELYGVTSLESLEELLKPFGKVGLYGKSFGVLKLKYAGYAIDFSPPRTESKSGFGHKGFNVVWHDHLTFPEAARRRDFTINAIGYDPLTHTILDPYKGIEDLNAKILRCVDPETFGDDPLRILRAVQFSARFELSCDTSLLELCTKMVAEGALQELPRERIFEELKKLFLLSPHPSRGLNLLEAMGGKYLFDPPSDDAWKRSLETVDTLVKNHLSSPVERLGSMFAAMLIECNDPLAVLERLGDQRTLHKTTLSILNYAKHSGNFTLPPQPLLQGRDLIALGLAPSERFSQILQEAYDAQLNHLFLTREEAVSWLKKHLVTES